MRQDIKSNMAMVIAITMVMCMMAVVINYAMSTLQKETISQKTLDAEKSFYSHLFVLANYNDNSQKVFDEMVKQNPIMAKMPAKQLEELKKEKTKKLTYKDFENTKDRKAYDDLFEKANKAKKDGKEISSKEFEKALVNLKKSTISMDVYTKNFDYIYLMSGKTGTFSGEKLSPKNMVTTSMKSQGVATQFVKNMTDMDMGTMLNQMYYTVMGLLPIFLLIIIIANGLVAEQVDKGSMAYILATPTNRSAVVITHILYLVFMPVFVIGMVCLVRIFTTYMFFDTVNLDKIIGLHIGMYALVEAVAGICYMGSCIFNSSKKAMIFGGGITMWSFLSSLLGFFGSDDIVMLGIGVEKMGIFNKMTLVGLYDLKSISTLGTDSVDDKFIYKLAILFAIAIICYFVGSMRFVKKDLPL